MLCVLLFSSSSFIHHFCFAHVPIDAYLNGQSSSVHSSLSVLTWLTDDWTEFCAGWWVTLSAIRQALSNGEWLFLLLLILLLSLLLLWLLWGQKPSKDTLIHIYTNTAHINTMCAKSEWKNVWKMVKTEATPRLSLSLSVCLSLLLPRVRCNVPVLLTSSCVSQTQNAYKNTKTKSNKIHVRILQLRVRSSKIPCKYHWDYLRLKTMLQL